MRKKETCVAASPTPKTLEDLATPCAYKRTHIERERQRLEYLESMLAELERLVK